MAEAFAEAIARLHAAMADVANGDPAAIKALYSQRDDATSFYGWGGYERAGPLSSSAGTGPAGSSGAAPSITRT